MAEDIFQWLKSKLNKLKEFTDTLCKISDVHYEAHPWTALKLISLMWWVDVYTKIIPRQPHFENYWYLDLLAGSGTNYIRETGDIIIGSPFIAYFFARQPFKKYVLIELDRERGQSLQNRISYLRLGNLATVYKGCDCNDIVSKLDINADHTLAFIDCEGLDVSWETVERLLEKRSDLIVVFQTQSLRRTLGRAKSGHKDKDKMTCFLGDDSWKDCSDQEELLDLYMNKLNSKRGYVRPVKIRGSYEMDIILACKPGPYTSAWDYLERRLRHVTDEDAKLALKMLKGEVKALTDFFKPSPTLNSWF